MVRMPSSWLASRAAPAGTGPAVSPQIRQPVRPHLSAYTSLVTVDLGNSGVAPTAVFANGEAWTLIGPAGTGGSWALDQAYLSTSVGPLDSSMCSLYVGPYMVPFQPVQMYQVVAGLAGGASQFGLGGVTVPMGWFCTAYWTGGTNGATAALRLTGTQTALTQ